MGGCADIFIQFTELDCNVNRWRVLMGYRRYDGNREVIFTDSKGMERWESVSLTTAKVLEHKLDVDAIRAGMLGGTCNESQWREELIPMLSIDYFNPVVPDWTQECMAEEIKF